MVKITQIKMTFSFRNLTLTPIGTAFESFMKIKPRILNNNTYHHTMQKCRDMRESCHYIRNIYALCGDLVKYVAFWDIFGV